VNHQPNTLRALAFMLVGMLTIPLVDVFAKFLGQQSVPILMMVWSRFFFGAIAALPFVLMRTGAQGLTSQHPKLQALRTFFLIGGTTFFFAGLLYLPIADTLALYFINPILITAMSPLLLGERVDIQRWLMVFVGFIGVLIVIRPGFQALNLGRVLCDCHQAHVWQGRCDCHEFSDLLVWRCATDAGASIFLGNAKRITMGHAHWHWRRCHSQPRHDCAGL
jgi:drug/metabolite transporter (DMT)-like permease